MQSKTATLEELCTEFAKGFNDCDDADINAAISVRRHLDVSRKSDLLQISPKNVIKELHPDVKLETGSRVSGGKQGEHGGGAEEELPSEMMYEQCMERTKTFAN